MEQKYHRLRVEITGACNLQCKYCFNSHFNDSKLIKSELKTEDIFKLISQASEKGIKDFYLIGGEPFIHKDIFKILSKINEFKGDISISTNATLLDNKKIKELKKYNIKNIAVSIDGLKSNDEVRKTSSYKKIIKTIKLLKKEITKNIHIITVINEKSKEDILDLYKILKDIGIKMWDLNHMFNEGRSKQHLKELEITNYPHLIEIYKKLLNIYFKDKKPFHLAIHNIYNSMILEEAYDEFDSNSHPCSYYLGILPIKPNGDLVMCPNFTDVKSNFKENMNLDDTINKRNADDFFKLKIKDLKFCSECKYLRMCGGGCRGDAIKMTGDIKNPDPLSCIFMSLVDKKIIPILPKKEKENYQKLIDKDKKEPLYKGENIMEALKNALQNS